MIHKIQTSATSQVYLEVINQKLTISKMLSTGRAPDSLLEFTQQQTQQLNSIIQSITGNYLPKEYGKIQIGNKTFKILLSTFRGITTLQIRERVTSGEYAGFGKLGISLPTYKIKELQTHMTTILKEFSAPLVDDVQKL